MTRWRDYDWQLIRAEPESPQMQMALDEVLVYAVGEGRRPPTLRIWEWTQPTVVLGRFQSVKNEVQPEGMKKHGVTLTRRISGGGAMFSEPGNATSYSLYAPLELVKGLSFIDSYAFLDRWVIEALTALGVEAFYQPINDISSAEGKIGGAAQTRRGGAVLHHAMISYQMDTAKMLEVLRIGKEKLSDKGTQSADKRVTPLSQQTQLPLEAILEQFIDTFGSNYGLSESAITPAEREAAEQLVKEKFSSDAWIHLLP